MKNVYFDNASSTPVDKEVLKAMEPLWDSNFGNPLSLHFFGQNAKKVLEQSRKTVADFLGVDNKEIVFTSGATESNNLAIKGVINGIMNHESRIMNDETQQRHTIEKAHVITSKIEHPSLLKPCEVAVEAGMIEATFLSVENNGIMDVEKFRQAIQKNTRLVSIMAVNNEVGTIQPIKEIGAIIAQENSRRGENEKIYFHTDMAQAYSFGYQASDLNIDLASFSGHKFYGPKGIGVLYVKEGTPFAPIAHGGMQENGMRPGTQNLPAIAGMAKAVEMLDKNDVQKVGKLKDILIDRVLTEVSDSHLNGSRENRVYNNINFSFIGVEGESLTLKLSERGFAISTGSACAVGATEVSHVLTDIGLSPQQARSSIRITLGKQNIEEEIHAFVEALKDSVHALRKISGQ